MVKNKDYPIIKGNYYILYQSNDIYDVVKVTYVSGPLVEYEYYKHDVNKQFSVLKNRQLNIKSFKACYKPYDIMNVLYGSKS